MKFRIRFLKFNEQGNTRKLATGKVEAETLADALRQVIGSLEQTRPDLLEQVAGIQVVGVPGRPTVTVEAPAGGSDEQDD